MSADPLCRDILTAARIDDLEIDVLGPVAVVTGFFRGRWGWASSVGRSPPAAPWCSSMPVATG